MPIHHIENSCLKVEIAPHIGGRLKRLYDKRLDREILYPMYLKNGHYQGGSYPLVPYSNRIENGHFMWQDQPIYLPPHSICKPHAIHGVGWISEWETTQINACTYNMTLLHDSNEHWLFDFRADQEISIINSSLKQTMRITNIDEQTQPVGLGFHPFFSAYQCEGIQFDAIHRWVLENGLPKTLVDNQSPSLFSDKKAITVHYDDLFEGWQPQLFRAYYDRYILEVSATSCCNKAVLFTNDPKHFFCFEPVSHTTNAINRSNHKAYGIYYLKPKQSFEISMFIEIKYS